MHVKSDVMHATHGWPEQPQRWAPHRPSAPEDQHPGAAPPQAPREPQL